MTTPHFYDSKLLLIFNYLVSQIIILHKVVVAKVWGQVIKIFLEMCHDDLVYQYDFLIWMGFIKAFVLFGRED